MDWGGGGGVIVLFAASKTEGDVRGGLDNGGIPEVATELRELSEDLRCVLEPSPDV